ncbi:Ig-like domain-containing protein [Rhodococcus xishaensis]|uniref:Ig-like domain repeat protein n=1 Tax=Rhodococcus xishaensis TaxID=2487364 RepID=A0A3S3B3C9_9NOCA|nr:Ig-like domain-containing protein [Rhodococcus xishaensis]RVW02147.1 Ig-like domain repeat protein [Rhodococcus xishaensis]
MNSSLATRCAAALTGATLTMGVMLVAAPAGAATSTLEFKNTCRATPSSAVAGPVDQTRDTEITVDAPTTVEPGETFAFRLQSAGQSYPDKESIATTKSLSRLKNDFEIPANATFVSAEIVANSGINLDLVPPSVIRVNDSGTEDPNGNILRISGNNEVIGNGASNSTSKEGGIRAPKLKLNLDGTPNSKGDSWFRMPAIEVTMVAGQSGVIEPKLRTSGDAGKFNDNKNFSTQLALASAFGDQWAPTRCSPRDSKSSGLNAGAGPLTTIRIVAPDVITSTTLTVPDTATTGTPVELTAAVEPAEASGTVQFKDNGTDIGAPVPVISGAASLAYTFGALGDRSITAEFSGATGFASSASEPRTVTVTPPVMGTTTSVTVPPTATTGLAVDLIAAVNPPGVDGTVQFRDGDTDIGDPVPVAGGIATLSHSFTTTGDHSITAAFLGSAAHAPSTSGARVVAVSEPLPDAVATTTELTVPATAEVGTVVPFSATVSPTPVDGTVQFRDGATNLGSPVLVVDGVASLSHTFTRGGSHSITAVYSGGVGSLGSTAAPVTVDVTATNIGTATLLNAPGEAKTDKPVDLWASTFDLWDGAPVPDGGTVQFRDGEALIGSPVPVVDGFAKLTHTFDSTGVHAISAEFSGVGAFQGSTTDPQDINVTVASVADLATATELGLPAVNTAGDPVILDARVVAPQTPNGTVQFFAGDTPLGEAVQLVDGYASLAHTFAEAGSHAITAKYSGAAGFTESTSIPGTLVINPVATPAGSVAFGS